MRRYRLPLGLVALALLGLVGLCTWALIPPPPGVTPANAHLIRIGMSQKQVESLMGGPPKRSGPFLYDEKDPVPAGTSGEWEGPEGRITVYFDKAGGTLLVVTALRSADEPRFLRWLRRVLRQ
jgi:hypothetical protein